MSAKTANAKQTAPTPGAPPAFGTSAPVGPAVSAETFAQAEKLVQVKMSPRDLAQAARNWQQSMASVYERRTGPRKLRTEDTIAPATLWNPTLSGTSSGPKQDRLSTNGGPVPALPAKDEDIAFASVSSLSAWIESRQITSERLTNIYLDRLERFDPKLRCVITLTRDHALAQARAADKEIAAGHYRGPRSGGGPNRATSRRRDYFDSETTCGAWRSKDDLEGSWRRDHEPLAARRGFLGIECWPRCGSCGGSRRLCHWERDPGQHR